MVLWGIYNENILYTIIKRYLQRSILYRIHKGMYSTVPVKEISSWLLGSKALHNYNYISIESILVKEGIINQLSNKITLISNKSLKFQWGDVSFVS